jgi:hypothetical protein
MHEVANELKTVDYAARRLGVRPCRVWTLVREGILAAPVVVRLGRHIKINPTALESFIDAGGKSLPGGWRREQQ